MRWPLVGVALLIFLAGAALFVWPPADMNRDGRQVRCAAPIWYGIPDATFDPEHPDDAAFCWDRIRWRWWPMAGLFLAGGGVLVLSYRRRGQPTPF
jgi:hypothetical protein